MGDSAQRYRISRNGLLCRGKKGEEMGGDCKHAGNCTFFAAAHLLPIVTFGRAPFRRRR